MWEQAKLTCLDRCGGGTSWCGMGCGSEGGGTSGCARHGPIRNSVLSPSRGRGVVTKDSVIFFVRYAAWSFMHKHVHMV